MLFLLLFISLVLVVRNWLCQIILFSRSVHLLPLLYRLGQHLAFHDSQLGLNRVLVQSIFDYHESQFVFFLLELGEFGRHLLPHLLHRCADSVVAFCFEPSCCEQVVGPRCHHAGSPVAILGEAFIAKLRTILRGYLWLQINLHTGLLARRLA